MKTQELIVELEKLASLHPNAELRLEFFDNAKDKGPVTRPAGFVYAKVVEGCPTLRITDELFVDEVRRRDA